MVLWKSERGWPAPTADNFTSTSAPWVATMVNVTRAVRGSTRAGSTGRTATAKVRRCLAERGELGGCEQIRIEFRERISFNGGAEVQYGGVALPGEGEAGAQILVRLDPLFLRYLERPVGRDDLAQQRQGALHFEPLVQLVGLPQQLRGAALSGERADGGGDDDRRQRERPHPAPRLRNVTRPSDSVPPGSITTVVSNVS